MTLLTTGKINLPTTIASGLIRKIQDGSTITRLSASEPFRFGETDFQTVNLNAKAQFVGEGGEKKATKTEFGKHKAKPYKAQVTMRFNEEVLWADQDHQLGVLAELATQGSEALQRALDLGIFHAVDPLSGDAMASSPAHIGQTTNIVTASADGELDIEKAAGLLIKGKRIVPTGVALDPALAYDLSVSRDAQGRKKFPDLGLDPSKITSFGGMTAAVGDTVTAPEATVAPDTRAILGDFRNGLRWGVARQLPVELIRTGDPDGEGDLKRYNQIALRLETVFVWYVDPTKFAVIKDGTP